MENSSTKRMAQSTLALIVFALVGKVFGFARESLMAYYFGAGIEVDAFVAAQKSTALLSGIVSATIATILIPMLTKVELAEGAERKSYHTNNMLTLAVLAGAIMAGLGMLFAPVLTKLIGGGFGKEQFDLTVELTRVGMPVIIFSAIVGVLTGFLQSEGKFAATGAIAIPLNVVYISYMVILSDTFGIRGLTIASVLGILAQVIFLLPETIKCKFKYFFVFDIKDKFVINALILSIPVLFSVAINDINVIVNTRFASGLAEGTVAVLSYANKLNTLILGIFVSAITAVIFPVLSREFSSGRMDRGKAAMNGSVKFIVLITIPSMIGLMVLSQPIVEVAFLRGEFNHAAAELTSSALRFYSLALCAMSLNNLLNRVYYSLQDTKTPFIIGILYVALNIGLNFILVRFMGHNGLAFALSIAINISVITSFVLLHRKIGRIGIKGYIRTLIKSLIAAGIMGLVANFTYFNLEALLGNSTAIKLACLLVTVAISVFVYGLICYVLGVKEVRMLVEFTKKKFNKN
ncbi:MAG: murein biosynthesis integral membrane protein MurJ [Tissierellia bacterium]|nr:murein biosynthesis integral membrane protein MurJ [Tissierellia bacterium]